MWDHGDSRRSCDIDGEMRMLCDVVCDYALEDLGADDAVLVIDETGLLDSRARHRVAWDANTLRRPAR